MSIQVGETIACGHCEPDKYQKIEEIAPSLKCDCRCHTPPTCCKKCRLVIATRFSDEPLHVSTPCIDPGCECHKKKFFVSQQVGNRKPKVEGYDV